MNIRIFGLIFSVFFIAIQPCLSMDGDKAQEAEYPYLPSIPMPSGEEYLSQMPPEVLEHILSFVIANDPEAVGNLAKIQEVCKGLAGFLSKDELKWILELDDSKLESYIYLALKEMDPKKVQLAVNLGALYNKPKDLIILDAIHYAVSYSTTHRDYYEKILQIIAILEKAGCNWERISSETAKETYHYAITMKVEDIVKLLLDHGIKPTVDAFQRALIHCDFEVIKLMLDHGIQPTELDIRVAISIDDFEITKLLLDYGAPVSEVHIGLVAKNDDLKFLKLLVQYGAKHLNKQGYDSALEYANTPEIAKILLEAGAMPDARILTDAVYYKKDPELVKLLIEYGADVNATAYNFMMPPLAYVQSAEMAKILLQSGAQLFIDCDGMTPFQQLVQKAISKKNPLILIEVLKTRYPYQTAVAIATAIMMGAPYISTVCNIL